MKIKTTRERVSIDMPANLVVVCMFILTRLVFVLLAEPFTTNPLTPGRTDSAVTRIHVAIEL